VPETEDEEQGLNPQTPPGDFAEEESHHPSPPRTPNHDATFADAQAQLQQFMTQVEAALPPDQTLPTAYGTITLARNVNELMDRAQTFFGCGISDVHHCKGCETRITDQTTAELQPEMVAMVNGFFKNWGHSDIFMQCEYASDFFNAKVIPIYNARIAQIQREHVQAAAGQAGLGVRPMTQEDTYIMDTLRTLDPDYLQAPQEQAPPQPSQHQQPVDTLTSDPAIMEERIRTPEEMATLVNKIWATSKRPLTAWSPRSVFDHFVLHVKMPIVVELVLLIQLQYHIQSLDGLMFIEIPGPGGTRVKEVMHKTADTWLKFTKHLALFNDRLSTTLKEGSHVTSSITQGLSQSAVLNNAWQTPFTTVTTAKTLYTNR
jgi:hypothetical protein